MVKQGSVYINPNVHYRDLVMESRIKVYVVQVVSQHFYNQIGTSLFDRTGESFSSNKLSGGLTNTQNTQSSFSSISDENQTSSYILLGTSPPVHYTHFDSCSKTAIQCKQLTG